MNTLWQDIRFGVRMVWKNPGFSFMVVFTLALGIGGSTAVFSIINAMLLRPLPYHEPENLVQILTNTSNLGAQINRSSYANYLDWKNQSSSFEDMAVYDPLSLILTGEDYTERVSAIRTSANLFSIYGVSPILGRTFTTEEANQRSRVVVISYSLWHRMFAGSSNVIGRMIEIDELPSEIIGVMPQNFGEDISLWEPHTLFKNWDSLAVQRGMGGWFVLGRLKKDRNLTQAQTELQNVAATLAKEYPEDNAGLSASLIPLSQTTTSPNMRFAIWMLFGAVLFVLLIGCTNLTNLLLVRSVIRRKEMATRLAIGASPFLIIRQLMIESVPLIFISGAIGIWLADIILQILQSAMGSRIPRLTETGLDPYVLIFAAALLGMISIVFGIVPGIQLMCISMNDSLKEGERTTNGANQSTIQKNLVITEVALASLLLFGAGLFIRSFQAILAIDPGFRSENVLITNLRFPRSIDSETVISFYDELSRQLQQLPGIDSIGLIEDVFGGNNFNGNLTMEGKVTEFSQIRLDAINPDFFKSASVPLLKGRFFDSTDRTDTVPVAIINRAMATRYWQDQDPIGKRFKFGNTNSEANWITVTGVVGDMRRNGLELDAMPQLFLPLAQNPSFGVEMLIKTTSGSSGLKDHIRQIVHTIDNRVATSGVTELQSKMSDSLMERRFQTSLLSAFSFVALVLAGIGMYGIMHFSVQQRTREIAIRMSVGATFSEVLFLMLYQGIKPGLIGIVLGVFFGVITSLYMQHLLFEIQPSDPATLITVPILLIIVSLLACYIPARRAANVDPMTALRCE